MKLRSRAQVDRDVAETLTQTTALINGLEAKQNTVGLCSDEQALGGCALRLEAALQRLLAVETLADVWDAEADASEDTHAAMVKVYRAAAKDLRTVLGGGEVS